MKLLLIVFLILLFPSLQYAQSSEKILLRIDFVDKGDSKQLLADPSQFLSSKALERRQKHSLSVNSSDLPVNQDYVNSIAEMDVRIVARSKWFNYVIVESDPIVKEKIKSYSFVKSVKEINNKVHPSGNIVSKEFFQSEILAPYAATAVKSVSSNRYNYGSAANQINMIKGEFLHNQGYCGQGMTIAVLDAGFNSVDIMNAFDSLRAGNQIKGVHNFVDNGSVYDPGISSHGTMVLSTMAANIPGEMVGTAPQADYWLLRSEDATAEYIMEEYFWVEAAEFADSLGADVINSSLGYTTFDDPTSDHTYEDMDGNTTVITIGADKAAEKGMLVVNSAGNSGGNQWHYIGAPADGDSVFTIGSVDAFGNYSYFSSAGPTYDGRIKPVVAAQGQSAAVYSPWGINFGSGTSFSSPIMAGISACLWQAAPSINNMQLQDVIKFSASRATMPNDSIGWGIPDFSAAFSSLSTSSLREAPIESKMQFVPNPFVSVTAAKFNRVVRGRIGLLVFDLQGRLLRQMDWFEPTPTNMVRLPGLYDLKPGSYLVRMECEASIFNSILIKQ